MTTIDDVLASIATLQSTAQAYRDAQATPPTPPTQTPAVDVKVASIAIDTSRLVTLHSQYSQGHARNADLRYERSAHQLVVSGAHSEPFYVTNIAGSTFITGGFAYPEYRLFFDGVQVAVSHPATGSSADAFAIPAPTVTKWAYAEIRPYDASGNPVANPVESYCPYWIVLDADGTAKDLPDIVAQTTSKTWFDRSQLAYNPIDAATAGTTTTKTFYQQASIPKSARVKQSLPLAVTATVPAVNARGENPFTDALLYTQITRTNIVPHRDGDNWRPAVMNSGIVCAANRQGYYIEDTTMPKPRFPLLDGPRGTATEYFPRVIRPGRGGKEFVSNPWACARYVPNGEKQTMWGWRCIDNPYWEDSQTSPLWELVGDWSAIPAARQGMLDCWGWDWDIRSIAQGAPTNVVVGGEVVHNGDVVAYFTDHMGGGRLVQARRVGNDPNHLTTSEAPFVLREVILPGKLIDPWWIECTADGVAYICERGRHAISMWQLPDPQDKTGVPAYIGDFVASPQASALGGFEDSGAALGQEAYRRFILNNGVTTAQALALDCVAPECVRIYNGFVYYGTLLTTLPGPSGVAEVRRKPAAGGAIESVCRPTVTNKSHFCGFDISDATKGNFGPEGTVFTVTFEEGAFGRPRAFLPNTPANGVLQTTEWKYQSFASYNVDSGPGPTASLVYAMGVGVAHGRLVCGSSEEGLIRYDKALAGEVTSNQAQMDTGGRKFTRGGGKLVLGEHGYGHYNATMNALTSDTDVAYFLAHS